MRKDDAPVARRGILQRLRGGRAGRVGILLAALVGTIWLAGLRPCCEALAAAIPHTHGQSRAHVDTDHSALPQAPHVHCDDSTAASVVPGPVLDAVGLASTSPGGKALPPRGDTLQWRLAWSPSVPVATHPPPFSYTALHLRLQRFLE